MKRKKGSLLKPRVVLQCAACNGRFKVPQVKVQTAACPFCGMLGVVLIGDETRYARTKINANLRFHGATRTVAYTSTFIYAQGNLSSVVQWMAPFKPCRGCLYSNGGTTCHKPGRPGATTQPNGSCENYAPKALPWPPVPQAPQGELR